VIIFGILMGILLYRFILVGGIELAFRLLDSISLIEDSIFDKEQME
jgi:hypothetical protein